MQCVFVDLNIGCVVVFCPRNWLVYYVVYTGTGSGVRGRVADTVLDIMDSCGARCIVLENLLWTKRDGSPVFWRAGLLGLEAKLKKKAREKGYETVFTSPRNTSRTCPVCGNRLRNRRGRKVYCSVCGLEMDRDVVAVLNMYSRFTGSRYVSKHDVLELGYAYVFVV